MTARTDVHRPSALDPADYDNVGWIDYGGRMEPGGQWIQPEHARQEWANVHGGSQQCDHCGNRIRYGEVYLHGPSDQLVVVGLQCVVTLDLPQ